MTYMSAREAAEKWGISRRRVQLLCGQGRLDGAFQIGKVWVIPQSTNKPKDARIVTGKYCKRAEPYGVENDQSYTSPILFE